MASQSRSGRGDVLQIWLENQDICDVLVHILPDDDIDDDYGTRPSAAMVYASSQLLSKISYFATSLRAPWQPRTITSISIQKTHIKQEIFLRCPALITPRDVCVCLKVLNSNDEGVVWTVKLVLKVLSVANYLGYEECVDLCMDYLAAAVWSSEEKAAVKKAFDAMVIKPSADVWTKLQPIETADRLLKNMLEAHAERGFRFLQHFVRHGCSKSQKIERLYRSALIGVWASSMEQVISNNMEINMLVWSRYTRILLSLGEAGTIFGMFFERCSDFCNAVMDAIDYEEEIGKHEEATTIETIAPCLAELLESVVPNKGIGRPSLMHSRAFLLTNSERARLVDVIFPLAMELGRHKKRLLALVENIILSLPLEVEGNSHLINKNGPLSYYLLHKSESVLRKFFSDLESYAYP